MYILFVKLMKLFISAGFQHVLKCSRIRVSCGSIWWVQMIQTPRSWYRSSTPVWQLSCLYSSGVWWSTHSKISYSSLKHTKWVLYIWYTRLYFDFFFIPLRQWYHTKSMPFRFCILLIVYFLLFSCRKRQTFCFTEWNRFACQADSYLKICHQEANFKSVCGLVLKITTYSTLWTWLTLGSYVRKLLSVFFWELRLQNQKKNLFFC